MEMRIMLHRDNKQHSTLSGRVPLRVVLLAFVVLAVLLLAGAFFQSSFAQQDEKLNRFVDTQNAAAAQLFREGRDLIGDEDWKQAEGKFRRFVSQYPKDKNVDAALYWMAFALSKQGKYAEADNQLKKLLAEFPRSDWADDATALRAQMNVDPRVVDQ